MAGPGGGPPRKSHTKSRKGCKTCKRRHIRCDEQFPQCRNCTKHNCRCDYMDSPPPSDEIPPSPKVPNLLLTPMIAAEIDQWQRTGVFPFPELQLRNHHQFHGLTKTDLRLVHHLCSIYKELHSKQLVNCTAWVEKLPAFLDTAAGFDFVMSAILAFSATHLASETSSTETGNLAYHHRGVALNGLHGAIGNFSEANSDAILAASILLSWQASDWGGWTSLMQGISTVTSSMDGWKETSNFAYYVENHVLCKPPTFVRPSMGPMLAPLLPEDDASLQEAIQALQQLCSYLQTNVPLYQFVDEILQNAQDIQHCSSTTRSEQFFEKLQFLRTCLLWTPIALIQNPTTPTLNMLVVAHLYATALAVDASFPELNGAAFGALTTAPIEEIDRRMRFASPLPFQPFESAGLDDMMQFPREIASRTRYHRSSITSTGQEAILPGQQSPYGFQALHLDSAPTTPNFPPTYPMFATYSSEDLSVPPSPFLNTYNPPSRRHSALIEHPSRPSSLVFEHSPRPGSFSYEHSPRPGSLHLDNRPFSGFGRDSPSYSPAYSPGPAYLDDDLSFSYGSSAENYVGFVAPPIWA